MAIGSFRRGGVKTRVLLALAFALLIAADWPQFLGPNRDGTSSETGLRAEWPANGPPVLWEKEVGPGYSGPVVVGDGLIVFHRVGDEEVVERWDAGTGQPRWKFAYASAYQDKFGKGDGPRSTPCVVGGRVFTLGADGKLHCLNFETGQKIWARDLPGEYKAPGNFFGVGTSPLVEGDRVVINVGGPEAGIVAFDTGDGHEVWKATGDEASYSSPTAATVGGTRLLCFLTRVGFVAVEPKTGAVRFTKPWRARFNASVNAATPLVVGDEVFLSASYNTGAALLRLGKGGPTEVWKGDEILSNHYTTSVYHDGFLYGFDGRQEEGARLRCVEFRTGKVRWTRERFGCGSMLLAGGKLIILSEDGELVSADATPEAYHENSRVRVLSSPCRAPLALADGRLFGRDDRKLVCWNFKK